MLAGLVGQRFEQQQVVQVDGSVAGEIVAGDRGRRLVLLLLLLLLRGVEQGGQLQAVRVVFVERRGKSVEPGRAAAVLLRSLDIRPLEDTREHEQAMLEQPERVLRTGDHPSPAGEENGDSER